jgi:hypothetical protein
MTAKPPNMPIRRFHFPVNQEAGKAHPVHGQQQALQNQENAARIAFRKNSRKIGDAAAYRTDGQENQE